MSNALDLPISFDLLCEEGDRTLSRLRKELKNSSSFTLNQMVDAFEKSWEFRSSHGISYNYTFSVCPKGTIWNREANVFLGKSIHIEGDVQCASIYSALTLKEGISGLWLSNRKLLLASDCNVFSEEEFYREVRKSQIFRWLADRRPATCSLSILKMDWETFFESAKTFIPEFIKAGIWKCDGPTCSLGHARTETTE